MYACFYCIFYQITYVYLSFNTKPTSKALFMANSKCNTINMMDIINSLN